MDARERCRDRTKHRENDPSARLYVPNAPPRQRTILRSQAAERKHSEQ